MYTNAENMNMINQAERRVSMEWQLKQIGCQLDGRETASQLEDMMRTNNLEV